MTRTPKDERILALYADTLTLMNDFLEIEEKEDPLCDAIPLILNNCSTLLVQIFHDHGRSILDASEIMKVLVREVFHGMVMFEDGKEKPTA